MPEAPNTVPGGRRRRRRRGRRGRGGAPSGQQGSAPRTRVVRVPLEPIDLPAVIASAPLLIYCRECRAEVTGEFANGKMSCTVCKSPKVAYGTDISVRNYFRLGGERPKVRID